MRIVITGATGFVGRALVDRLLASGHELVCLHRERSNTEWLKRHGSIRLVECELGRITDEGVADEIIDGCDAIVHSALWRPGVGFRGAEGDVVEFARINVLGSLRLMEAARNADVKRFVFVSTCAVHEQILDDRPLDEAHPLWPLTHYGAHKAAIEKFVHSFGLGMDYGICSIRPTGIYGIADPVEKSKWYELVADVVAGNDVTVRGGGKEVHVEDVARGIEVLLNAPHEAIKGQSFACYDRYVSQHEVASIAKELTGSSTSISGEPKTPKHQIQTQKLRELGMEFGGGELLETTIRKLIESYGQDAD